QIFAGVVLQCFLSFIRTGESAIISYAWAHMRFLKDTSSEVLCLPYLRFSKIFNPRMKFPFAAANKSLATLSFIPPEICMLRRGPPTLDSIIMRYSGVPGFAFLEMSFFTLQYKNRMTSEWSFISAIVSFLVNFPFCGVYGTYFRASIHPHSSMAGEAAGLS